MESEENECPDCHGKEISPETLIPNRYLRNAVNGFKDKTGYSKRIEAVKEKIIPPKEEVPVPQTNVEPPPKEGKYVQFISDKCSTIPVTFYSLPNHFAFPASLHI